MLMLYGGDLYEFFVWKIWNKMTISSKTKHKQYVVVKIGK